MVLRQYYLDCLAHASDLIADQEHGEAAVVDPQRDGNTSTTQDASDAESLTLDDLLGGVCRHNPTRVSAAYYRNRLVARDCSARWPQVRYIVVECS